MLCLRLLNEVWPGQFIVGKLFTLSAYFAVFVYSKFCAKPLYFLGINFLLGLISMAKLIILLIIKCYYRPAIGRGK